MLLVECAGELLDVIRAIDQCADQDLRWFEQHGQRFDLLWSDIQPDPCWFTDTPGIKVVSELADQVLHRRGRKQRCVFDFLNHQVQRPGVHNAQRLPVGKPGRWEAFPDDFRFDALADSVGRAVDEPGPCKGIFNDLIGHD